MRKISFAVGVFFLSLILFSAVALANTAKVNHVAGTFEKIREKINLIFIFDKAAKANYQQELTEKRLQEMEYIMEANKIDLLEPTASRYTTYAGNLVNFAVANKVTAKKDDLIKMFKDHEIRVEELQKKIPLDSGWWLALQHGINVAKQSKERISTL